MQGKRDRSEDYFKPLIGEYYRSTIPPRPIYAGGLSPPLKKAKPISSSISAYDEQRALLQKLTNSAHSGDVSAIPSISRSTMAESLFKGPKSGFQDQTGQIRVDARAKPIMSLFHNVNSALPASEAEPSANLLLKALPTHILMILKKGFSNQIISNDEIQILRRMITNFVEVDTNPRPLMTIYRMKLPDAIVQKVVDDKVQKALQDYETRRAALFNLTDKQSAASGAGMCDGSLTPEDALSTYAPQALGILRRAAAGRPVASDEIQTLRWGLLQVLNAGEDPQPCVELYEAMLPAEAVTRVLNAGMQAKLAFASGVLTGMFSATQSGSMFGVSNKGTPKVKCDSIFDEVQWKNPWSFDSEKEKRPIYDPFKDDDPIVQGSMNITKVKRVPLFENLALGLAAERGAEKLQRVEKADNDKITVDLSKYGGALDEDVEVASNLRSIFKSAPRRAALLETDDECGNDGTDGIMATSTPLQHVASSGTVGHMPPRAPPLYNPFMTGFRGTRMTVPLMGLQREQGGYAGGLRPPIEFPRWSAVRPPYCGSVMTRMDMGPPPRSGQPYRPLLEPMLAKLSPRIWYILYKTEVDTTEVMELRSLLREGMGRRENVFALVRLYATLLSSANFTRVMNNNWLQRLKLYGWQILSMPEEVIDEFLSGIKKIPLSLLPTKEEIKGRNMGVGDIPLKERLQRDPATYTLAEIPGVQYDRYGQATGSKRTRRWLQSVLYVQGMKGEDVKPFLAKMKELFGEEFVKETVNHPRTKKALACAKRRKQEEAQRSAWGDGEQEKIAELKSKEVISGNDSGSDSDNCVL